MRGWDIAYVAMLMIVMVLAVAITIAVSISFAVSGVLLFPLAGGVAVALGIALVARSDPDGIVLRWNDIAASLPVVALVVPIPVAIDPDGSSGSVCGAVFDDDWRRR